MTIYDSRDKPAYGNFRAERRYDENPYILKWWTPSHDELLARQIAGHQWMWYWGITDQIVAITPQEIVDAWRTEDPLCSNYAWYNILMYFAASRAEKLGLTKKIRKPQWKVCPLCDQKFVEDSLPVPLVERLGINQLDFCAPCLSSALLQNSGNKTSSKEEVLVYLRDLVEVLGRIPAQDFGEGKDDIADLDASERLAVLRVLKRKPALERVKELFSSWFKALIKAGVLENETRRTGRGIQCLAKDGHVCLSLGEKTIDDTLNTLRIHHEKEGPYPEGHFRADFVVKDVFIEYFGLSGDTAYDERTTLKQEICKKNGIRLISIYAEDLASLKKLKSKLLEGLSL